MRAAHDPLGQLAIRVREDRPWIYPAVALVTVSHGLLVFAIARSRLRSPPAPAQMITFAIDLDRLEPPPAPRPTPPAHTPSEGALAKAPPSHTAVAASPARAAAVLTRTPHPDEPVDLTDQSFVVGSAAAYSGGATAASGTGASPAPGRAALPPASGATPPSTVPLGPDRSRRAEVAGGADWKCPFPAEADTDSVDTAVVTLRVDVGASGAPLASTVVLDPGHGFGREAQRCAASKRWTPALDREGNPIAGAVTIRVRFDR